MKILHNKEYRNLLTQQMKEQLLFFLKNSEEFLIIVNMDGVKFNPVLPKEITDTFNKDFMPFAIGGYTFKSAFVENNTFIFEAGFGNENIGAMVYIDIDRILQILISENPIFINITATAPKETPKNSFDVFASKKSNQKFFKKIKS